MEWARDEKRGALREGDRNESGLAWEKEEMKAAQMVGQSGG